MMDTETNSAGKRDFDPDYDEEAALEAERRMRDGTAKDPGDSAKQGEIKAPGHDKAAVAEAERRMRGIGADNPSHTPETAE